MISVRLLAPVLAPVVLAPMVATSLMACPALAQTDQSPTPPDASQSSGAASPQSPATGGAEAEPSSGGAVSGAFTPISPAPGANILAELRASGEFTTLLKALDATALTSVIQSQPNITLLAPTDSAFAALPPAELTTLMQPASAAKLQALLTYHLVNARVSLDKVKNHAAGPVTTVATKPVTIDGTGAAIKINDANVLQAAVPASNGLIYVIDKVLTPSS